VARANKVRAVEYQHVEGVAPRRRRQLNFRATRFTEGHHVKHWADGGETKLGNLITLCSFHHRLVHEGGYGLTTTDDGLFVFTRPDGRRVEPNGAHCFRGNISPLAPSTYRGFDDSLRDYLKKHEPGLSITAETSRCRRDGESMDYSQAIESMQFLDRKAAVREPLPACSG